MHSSYNIFTVNKNFEISNKKCSNEYEQDAALSNADNNKEILLAFPDDGYNDNFLKEVVSELKAHGSKYVLEEILGIG